MRRKSVGHREAQHQKWPRGLVTTQAKVRSAERHQVHRNVALHLVQERVLHEQSVCEDLVSPKTLFDLAVPSPSKVPGPARGQTSSPAGPTHPKMSSVCTSCTTTSACQCCSNFPEPLYREVLRQVPEEVNHNTFTEARQHIRGDRNQGRSHALSGETAWRGRGHAHRCCP